MNPHFHKSRHRTQDTDVDIHHTSHITYITHTSVSYFARKLQSVKGEGTISLSVFHHAIGSPAELRRKRLLHALCFALVARSEEGDGVRDIASTHRSQRTCQIGLCRSLQACYEQGHGDIPTRSNIATQWL